MPPKAQKQRTEEEERGDVSDSEGETDKLSLVSFKTVVFSGKRADDFHEWSGKFLPLLPASFKTSLIDPATIPEAELARLAPENAKLYRRLLLSTKGLANAIVASVADWDGRQAWLELKEKFTARTQARALELMLELINMRYDLSTDFDEFFLHAEYIQRQLKLLGEPVGDLMLRGFIINSLPPEFESVRAIIQVQDDISNKELRRMLRAHYDYNSNSNYQNLNSNVGKERTVAWSARSAPQPPSSAAVPAFNGACGWCSKVGHKEKQCRRKQAGYPPAKESFAAKRKAQQQGAGDGEGDPGANYPVRACSAQALTITVPANGYIPTRRYIQEALEDSYSAKYAA